MTKKALMILAPGVEEMEAVVLTDVLRRGDVEVTIAGIPDSNLVTGNMNIKIKPDVGIKDAPKKGPYDIVILPGGLDGAQVLAQSKEVGDFVREQEKSGRLTGAICAGPLVLKAHGCYVGKSLTSWPENEAELTAGGYIYKAQDIVIDGTLITSRGPCTAVELGLTLVEKLKGKEKSDWVSKELLLNYK